MGLQDRELSATRPSFLRAPASFLVVFLGILSLNFFLIQVGGSTALQEVMTMETRSDPDTLRRRIEVYREEQGLDEPILTRLGTWFSNLVRLDFGRSMTEDRPVTEILGPAMTRSLWVQIPAFLLVFVFGIPFGVYLALRSRRLDGRVAGLFSYGLLAVPGFWFATLLLVYLATDQGLDLFPLEGLSGRDSDSLGFAARGWDRLLHLALPVLALGFPAAIAVARQVRQGMLESLQSSQALAARSLGLSERRIIWVHSLRQALVPVAVLFGLLLPTLVGGSVVVERIFNIPGLGSLLVQAVLARDMPLLQALVLIASLATLLGFVIADLLVRLLAPAAHRRVA